MPTSSRLPGHLRVSRRDSLRWRLPFFVSLLIVAALASFLWVAYQRVDATLLGAAHERLLRTAEQVADFVGQGQLGVAAQRAADQPAVRAFLLQPSPGTEADVRRLLASVARASPPQRAEIWNARGERLLEVHSPAPSSGAWAGVVLSEANPPSAAGVQPLRPIGQRAFAEMVGEVKDGGETIGFLVLSSALSISPPGILGRLVGHDASVVLGNRADSFWTTLDQPAAPPPIDRSASGVFEYTSAEGERRLGALVGVEATPWAVWVEMPRETFMAPGRQFLFTMLPAVALFVVAFVVLARAVSTKVTQPLFDLSSAAVDVANGKYDQHVPVRLRDEVGVLAEAFNSMTSEIGSARRDLEKRVEARTAELVAARAEADRANRAKNEFLSLMSHDLRTPLNAILGFAQLLETDNLTTEQRENVAQILSGGRHLLDLISDVLDITRIESGQLSLSLEPVSVREIVERQIDLVRPLAAERRVTFTMGQIDSSLAVMADRQRLRQILLNLFSNAVKYNKRGGTVHVEAGPDGDGRYRISVTDTGAGIPMYKMSRLFRPFERLGAEQSAIEGTGLGLALSKALAEAMGGSLGASSIVDTGSTFWLELAAAAPPAPAPEREQPQTAPDAPARSGLVLYIEDNRSNVRLVERVLARRPGVRLLHAPTGESGVSLCRSRRPDLVLVDLHLPDMGGEEVLLQLWRDPGTRPIPKVVVTADATPGLARRLQAEGATAVLTKPLNLQELLARLDALLGGKEA